MSATRRNPKRCPGPRYGPLTGLLLVSILVSNPGCSMNRAQRGASPSTLGHNLRTLPRGRMIAPPGLGVDLATAKQSASKDEAKALKLDTDVDFASSP